MASLARRTLDMLLLFINCLLTPKHTDRKTLISHKTCTATVEGTEGSGQQDYWLSKQGYVGNRGLLAKKTLAKVACRSTALFCRRFDPG